MLKSLLERIAAPRKLREAQSFLEDWCPADVEVVNDSKACWLHYGGMIYSYDYKSIPAPENVRYMLMHLENHKWCLQLAGGVYTHRSLLEAWVGKYLPDAHVVGFGPNDIVYPDECADRPLLKGESTIFAITHHGKFVTYAKVANPLPWLALDLKKKTDALLNGESIYIRGAA